MLQQTIEVPLMLFVAGFFAGFVACLVMRPAHASPKRTMDAIADDVRLSVQREFAKMAW